MGSKMYWKILIRCLGILCFTENLLSARAGNRNRNENSRCECGRARENVVLSSSSRIINGSIVEPSNKYPWVVAILKHDGTMGCGGAIISSKFVVSAAHCTLKEVDNSEVLISPKEFSVALPGKTGIPEKKLAVKRVIKHERFSKQTANYDIALFELENQLPCSQNARPICLPRPGMEKTGTSITIAGWGKTNIVGGTVKRLQEGKMKISNRRTCQSMRRRISICATGTSQGSCYGDSGSAAFVKKGGRYYALGITSKHTSMVCDPREPVVFTRILAFDKWIKTSMRSGGRGRNPKKRNG